MILSAYETAMGRLLGSAVDTAIWTTTILDEGLRQALAEYDDAAPPVEASLTVTVTGEQQDLSGVSGLKRMAGVAWPWAATGMSYVAFADYQRPFSLVGDRTVRLLDCCPAAGDVLRLRYWRANVIDDLDGAAATTVPVNDELLVVLGACAWACAIRYRQLVETVNPPAFMLKNLWDLKEQWLADFRAGLRAVTWSGGYGADGPNWATIGL